MPNKTTNYQLNQWAPTDNFLRADFNEDNAKLEEALTALAAGQVQITTGTYAGNGAFEGQEIPLGFHPRAVMIAASDGSTTCNGYIYGGLVLEGFPLQNRAGQYAAQITENGFMVRFSDSYRVYTNMNATTYHYLAIQW